MRFFRISLGLLGIACLLLAWGPRSTLADGENSLCIFDPLGTNGVMFDQIKDFQVAALESGVSLKLVPYTDERVAIEDFKAGQCDAVSVTGMRARQFNPFSGSLDSIGSMPTYEHLRSALSTLSSSKAAKYLTNGNYEVLGIIPEGSAYLFVNDRSIDTVPELSGKKIAVLEYDQAQQSLATATALTPVLSSVDNMYSKFNNHSVDVCGAPAALYETMELYKGLGDKGGIVRFGLTQITIQIIAHPDKFPAGFGQKSREYFFSRFDQFLKSIEQSETRIPDRYWINIPPQDREQYMETFRQSRIMLRDKGVYHEKMLGLLGQVRCQIEPQNSECTATDKE